jgi:hypothetical protein
MSSPPDVSLSPSTGDLPPSDAAAVTAGGAEAPQFSPTRSPERNPKFNVRAADLEPYIGLRYLSRLFKLMAVVLVLLLAAEVVTGFVSSGFDAFPTLVGEISRLIVLAGLLWGSGDLAILLIDMGHDLRATRILLGRQLAHQTGEQHSNTDPGVASS